MTRLALEEGVDWTFDSTTPNGELVDDALRGDLEARSKLPHRSLTVMAFCMCPKCEAFKKSIKFEVLKAVIN